MFDQVKVYRKIGTRICVNFDIYMMLPDVDFILSNVQVCTYCSSVVSMNASFNHTTVNHAIFTPPLRS